MIYLFVSQWEHIAKENIDTDKRDCRVIRQPLTLLPEDISRIIANTKNDALRLERKLAYTSLFSAAKEFFGIEKCTVIKNQDGKPYLVSADGSSIDNVHISLSHSNGISAVCISDEGDVGVDIQTLINEKKADRLKKRFFNELTVKKSDIDIIYYFCTVSEDYVTFTEESIINTDEDSFTAKWTYAESLMKLSGRGFGDQSIVELIAKNSRSTVRSVFLKEKYIVAVSVK